jgi:hypothetical protein
MNTNQISEDTYQFVSNLPLPYRKSLLMQMAEALFKHPNTLFSLTTEPPFSGKLNMANHTADRHDGTPTVPEFALAFWKENGDLELYLRAVPVRDKTEYSFNS